MLLYNSIWGGWITTPGFQSKKNGIRQLGFVPPPPSPSIGVGVKKTMTAMKQWLQRTVTAKSSFGRSLARKPRFHIFNLQILKKSRTKASFSHLQGSSHESSISHLQLADFEGGSHQSFLCNLCTTSTCMFWRKSRTYTSFSSACS